MALDALARVTEGTILVLNGGSSSLKFGLYSASAGRTETLLSGEAEAIGDPKGIFWVNDSSGRPIACDAGPVFDSREAVARLEGILAHAALPAPVAVGHRVVHGGPGLLRHCVLDAPVLAQLEAAAAFAPLHIPAALSLIRDAEAHFPGTPQIACFDTAFHADLPDVARVLPLPRAFQAAGIHRYGFHGLSCESILHQLEAPIPDRVIVAHLGNGASITAIKAGKSIDTSMGLTPTGGVVMGTRTGDLDPGVLLYLIREQGYDAAQLETLVDHRSGLLGISGLASDMRSLRRAAPSDPDARLALDMFSYAVAKQISAMIAALNGLDMLVFTGGIGENDGESRAAICGRLSWIGVALDDARNRHALDPVHGPESRCAIRILPSQEELAIARHSWALVH